MAGCKGHGPTQVGGQRAVECPRGHLVEAPSDRERGLLLCEQCAEGLLGSPMLAVSSPGAVSERPTLQGHSPLPFSGGFGNDELT